MPRIFANHSKLQGAIQSLRDSGLPPGPLSAGIPLIASGVSDQALVHAPVGTCTVLRRRGATRTDRVIPVEGLRRARLCRCTNRVTDFGELGRYLLCAEALSALSSKLDLLEADLAACRWVGYADLQLARNHLSTRGPVAELGRQIDEVATRCLHVDEAAARWRELNFERDGLLLWAAKSLQIRYRPRDDILTQLSDFYSGKRPLAPECPPDLVHAIDAEALRVSRLQKVVTYWEGNWHGGYESAALAQFALASADSKFLSWRPVDLPGDPRRALVIAGAGTAPQPEVAEMFCSLWQPRDSSTAYCDPVVAYAAASALRSN